MIMKNCLNFPNLDFTIFEFNFPILIMRGIRLRIRVGTEMLDPIVFFLNFWTKMSIIKIRRRIMSSALHPDKVVHKRRWQWKLN
jgi:hypothetical protein